MDTTTSCPVVDSSVLSPLPEPPKNPPPWMCTSTGRPVAASAGRHTFTNRQSSLVPEFDGDRQVLPNAVAAFVWVQAAAGSGGCQRRAPTGGAAYGIPSHSLTPLTVIPHTGPRFVGTSVPGAHATAGSAAAERD